MDLYLIQPRIVTSANMKCRYQPPDGIAYLADYLINKGFSIGLLDARTAKPDEREIRGNVALTGIADKELVDIVLAENPQAIGINYEFLTDAPSIKSLVKELRDRDYKGTIVLGGTGASPLHREILGDTPYAFEIIPGVDVVMTDRNLGSGEIPTEALLQALRKDESLANVPGISYREGKTVKTNKPAKVNLDVIGKPARYLYLKRNGVDIYSALNNPHSGPLPEDKLPYATLFTSRGCMYRCSFCQENDRSYGFNPGWTRKPEAMIREEIDGLANEGIKTILIQDDNFGGSSQRDVSQACDILDYIKQKGVQAIYFANGITVSSLINYNYKLLRKIGELAQSGINIRLGIPVESGSDEVLRLVRKPHRIEHLNDLFNAIKRFGLDKLSTLDLEAWGIVGIVAEENGKFVRETINQAQSTIEYLGGLGKRFPRIQLNLWFCKPIPGTKSYELLRKKYPLGLDPNMMFEHKAPGIWGTPEEEDELYRRVIGFNRELQSRGLRSTRPMFPEDIS